MATEHEQHETEQQRPGHQPGHHPLPAVAAAQQPGTTGMRGVLALLHGFTIATAPAVW